MESNNQNQFSVDGLLEEAQFSPAPAFRDALHDRLRQQLSAATMEQADARQRLNGSHHGRGWLTWRRVMVGAAVFIMSFASLVMLTPGVKAQVNSLLQHFGVQLPFTDAGLVISPFTPLAPVDVPAQMTNFASLNMDTGESDYVELRYFSQDDFLVIYETPAQAGDVFPVGESILLGDNDGVLNREMGGMVLLAAQGPQPWRKSGSGGGGGGGGGGGSSDAAGAPPQMLVYDSAIKLTWVQSDLRIELLTNLPQDEALRLAASMQPAPHLRTP